MVSLQALTNQKIAFAKIEHQAYLNALTDTAKECHAFGIASFVLMSLEDFLKELNEHYNTQIPPSDVTLATLGQRLQAKDIVGTEYLELVGLIESPCSWVDECIKACEAVQFSHRQCETTEIQIDFELNEAKSVPDHVAVPNWDYVIKSLDELISRLRQTLQEH